jgi:predicted amidohydrolase
VARSIVERHGDRTHNTAIALSPSGRLVARYRKVFDLGR